MQKVVEHFQSYRSAGLIKYLSNIPRPGIKTKKTLHSAINRKKIEAQNALLKKTIFPEIKKLFGVRKGCEMF